jgi:hypothetical protein
MAPIKFEEQLKDKLEKRSLSPSADGWSKLSERLDADEKNFKNPIFWWLSIAAGILIMVAIAAQFFGTDESQKVMPQVVEEKVIEEQLEDKQPILNDTKSNELVHEDSLGEKKENSASIKKAQIIDYKKATQKESKAEIQLAERSDSNTENSSTQQEGDILNKEVQDLLNEATLKNAVTDALKEIKSETASVTDRETDSLLKIASKELFKDKLQKETSKTVDANALLMSVEDDMGQSFRSKVFEALTESYKTVKTAVAERNN